MKTKFLSAISIFLLLVSTSPALAVVSLRDVSGTRYEVAIRALFEQRIVAGYPDGTFRPGAKINRAEYVGLTLAALQIALPRLHKNCFPDVTDQWFAPAVCYAKEQKWVSGYPDGLFRPTQNVNKVEAFAIFENAAQLKGSSVVNVPYTDVAGDSWYMTSLRKAYTQGLVEENTNLLNPTETITRGRAADILYRSMRGSVSTAPASTVSPQVGVVQDQLQPITNNVPTTRQKLTQDNFTYLGAFRLPRESLGSSRFGFGGGALAINPHGDPLGANDGYSGSLFIVGHENDQRVAEVTIPAPEKQAGQGVKGLPVAQFLQGFSDITRGKAQSFDEGNGYRIDGLAYLDAQNPQSSGKLYWTARTYYNVDTSDDLSHGLSDTDLSHPNAQGVWRLGDYHGMTTGGYIFPVPSYFADVYLAGKRLISGLSTQQGVSATSQGPAFFAFAPWLNYSGTTPPQDGAKLDAIRLVSYPYTGQPDPDKDPPSTFPDYQVPDSWDAAAWVDTPTKDAVVVVGHRAMGATYYGDARPGDCTIYKGYHGEPYQPRIIFYDTADLALAAQGKKDPKTIVPYLEWNPSQYLVNTCMWQLTGVVYDEEHQRMYLLQQDADTVDGEPQPLLYVFSVK